MRKVLLLAALVSSTSFAGLPGGLKLVSKNASNFLESNEKIVYAGKQINVSAENLNDLGASNLYVFPIKTFLDMRAGLENVAKIHHYEDGDFAIVEPKGDSEKPLAEFAHEMTAGCGALLQLNETSLMEDELLGKAGQPLNATNESRSEVSQLQSKVSHINISNSIKALESMGTRYHKSETGIQVPGFLADKYRALTPKDRTDVTVKTTEIRRSPQDNLVVRIEGSEKPDEVIILGSHIDSITSARGNNAPGGDDNASGTSINLEIFRIMMENGIKPKRTIEIHGYGAEEIGLVGSATLAHKYKNEKVNVKAMVQFDMALFSGRSGSLDTMYFVSNGTDNDLNTGLIELTKTYSLAKPKLGRLTAGTSDHQSWMRKGFAAAFPTENPANYNRKIHTPNDRLENLHKDASKFAALYAKLGVSYVMHYAGY